MSIQLIVTGQLEQKGLHTALQTLFPTASFRKPQYIDGFTSAKANLPFKKGSRVEKLARAMVAAIDPGRHGTPAELAIVIEDIELENMMAPQDLTELFLQAVSYVLSDEENDYNEQKRQLRRERVLSRCSFHLISPMIESYFFCSDKALQKAGIDLDDLLEQRCLRASMICPTHADVENFQVISDSEYTKDAPISRAKNPLANAFHPKRYLEYLCNPLVDRKRKYRETKAGVEALQALAANDWIEVLNREVAVPYLGSMLEDIADYMGLPSPYQGKCAELTSLAHIDYQKRIMRNM